MYLNLFTVYWIGWSKTVWHKTLHWLVWHFFKHCHLRFKKKLYCCPFLPVFSNQMNLFSRFSKLSLELFYWNLQILPFCPKICKFCHFVQKSAMNWREGGNEGRRSTAVWKNSDSSIFAISIRFTWLYIMICWWLPPSRGSKQHNPNENRWQNRCFEWSMLA